MHIKKGFFTSFFRKNKEKEKSKGIYSNNTEVQRISITNKPKVNNLNVNNNVNSNENYRPRIGVNNIEENMPVLAEIQKKKLVRENFGNIYVYKEPKAYNSLNITEIEINDNKILWEYYMLNNFLFTKELFDKKTDKSNINLKKYSNTQNIKNISNIYPLIIYPFKDSMEEFNKELISNKKIELEGNYLKLQNNKNLIKNIKKEKNILKSKLLEANKNININKIKLKIIKLQNNINNLEKNINIRNKVYLEKKIGFLKEKKEINLNRVLILLSKTESKKQKIEQYLESFIGSEEDKSKNMNLITTLQKNINTFKNKKNELEIKIKEFDKKIYDFELLNNKANLIRKLLEIINSNNILKDKIQKIQDFKVKFKNKINYYSELKNIGKETIFNKLSTKSSFLNENSNNIPLKNELELLKNILINELELIEKQINYTKSSFALQNGGFVDPFSGTIVAILSFVSMLFIHFMFIINIFAQYAVVACSYEMKNKSRIETIKDFIKTNFKDLFITYILIVTFTAIGPFGIILNHAILFGITKYIASKTINKTTEKIGITSSEQKFNKTLNFLCEKGKSVKSKSLINNAKTIAINQVNAQKFQIKCLFSSAQIIETNQHSNLNVINSNENIDVYRLILMPKKNNIYKFYIINLLNDTVYGYIEANANIVEQIYMQQNKKITIISKEKEDEILNSVNTFTGHVNNNFHSFVNFLRSYYGSK